MIEPNDLPIVCLPTGLPDQAAAEVLHFLQELAAAFERQYAGQSQQRISSQIELPYGLAGEDPRDPPLQLQSFVDRRKGNFGKHENSLTDLWRPSYSPQSGMTKCHFRPGNSSAVRMRGYPLSPPEST